MEVVLVIHLMLALAIIGLVLLQRSEGGGLGIGGGGGMGGLATPQATANALTKATGLCAACFFATSLILGIMAGSHGGATSILDQVEEVAAPVIEELDIEAIQGVIEDSQTLEPTVPISE